MNLILILVVIYYNKSNSIRMIIDKLIFYQYKVNSHNILSNKINRKLYNLRYTYYENENHDT